MLVDKVSKFIFAISTVAGFLIAIPLILILYPLAFLLQLGFYLIKTIVDTIRKKPVEAKDLYPGGEDE